MGFRSFFLLVCLFFNSLSFADSEIVWNADKRKPIRENILSCHTYLAPQEGTLSDTVAVLLSTNQIENFQSQLKKLVVERGLDSLKGGHIFVTGIPMGEEETQTKLLFENALLEVGLQESEFNVHVLSAPKSLLGKDPESAVKIFLERLRYFFPSIARDYQTPTLAEATSGIGSSVLIEAGNVAYLYQNMPFLDANLTLAGHTAVLTLYSIYKKFLFNWMLRPGGSKVEPFLKQMIVSFPFLLNYNVFGRFSTILNYYHEHGWAATTAQFPYEVANFASTQGLSTFLQTVFYTIVISGGVRAWENGQVGTERAETARSLSNWISVPILALASVSLAMAGSNSQPLMELGPLSINTGHAALLSLTAVGSTLWFWPQSLDPILNVYLKTKHFFFGKKTEENLTQP